MEFKIVIDRSILLMDDILQKKKLAKSPRSTRKNLANFLSKDPSYNARHINTTNMKY